MVVNMLLKKSSPDKELVKKVFISGGFPEKTYVKREKLERALEDVVNTNRIISITGVTKTGKTVLTQSLFDEKAVIRVNAGELNENDDFWHVLCSKCGDEVMTKCNLKATSINCNQHDISSGISLCGIGVKGSSNEGATTAIETHSGTSIKSVLSDFFSAHKEDRVVIIDDFHYLKEPTKKEIIRFFKAHVYNGLNLVLISIPHRSHEAVTVEKEMQGRVCPVQVDCWSVKELIQIAQIGFKMLGKEVEGEILEKFAQESYGSPHLMQSFCLDLSLSLIDSDRYSGITMLTPSVEQVENVLKRVANQVGKMLFAKIVKGLSGERKRKERFLNDGRQVDTYGLVAHTFTVLQPDMASIKISDFVKTAQQQCSKEPPLSHEITRVLQFIAREAVFDSASNPVIDLDLEHERCIYITDPFFAFYLKWGDCSIG